MNAYEIPLEPGSQRFRVDLGGVEYSLFVRWNEAASAYIIDISTASGDAIVSGIALVTGGDLLAQYGYLEIGGELHVQTDHDTDAMPTFDSLGTTSHVYFVVP